jgi:hypothetical protein
MELHDQCAPVARNAICLAISRERGLPPAPLPGGGHKSGRQGRQLACGTVSPARPASPLRELPPHLRRRANDLQPDPRPRLPLKANLLRFRAFCSDARLCPSPRGCRNGRQGRAVGIGHETPCVAQARVSRTRLSYAPSLTATRPSLCGRHIPIFES